MRLETEIHAAARLLGGPADSYSGNAVGLTVGQYKARVTFEESAYLRLEPHPQYDPLEFQNLAELASIFGEQGYDGGLQLIQATAKHFYETAIARDMPLNAPNFSVRYDMDIPRRLGFDETGALVTATLWNLLRWYGVSEYLTRDEIPSLAFEIESGELQRRVSLGNRVVQAFGGAWYMTFTQEQMQARGYGNYRRLPVDQLPPLFLAYLDEPGPADTVLSDMQQRWNEGVPEVRHAMTALAHIAENGAQAIERKEYGTISRLIMEDQQAQRKLYGDPALGPEMLRMLEIAGAHDLPATVSGTGISIGVLGDEPQNAAFADHLKAEGYHYLRMTVGPEMTGYENH